MERSGFDSGGRRNSLGETLRSLIQASAARSLPMSEVARSHHGGKEPITSAGTFTRGRLSGCYNGPMQMYGALAEWWPLLSAPEEYADEAAVFSRLLTDAGSPPQRTLLELGCGGGNIASFLKATWTMTLTDVSPRMLGVSRALNPECAHAEGDMRTLRINQLFDGVFVHDAVCYMTTEADLLAAITTAAVHCRPGGVALFAPDWVGESYAPGTDTGGHDGQDGRALRYLEWSHPVRPGDNRYTVDYVIVTHDGSGESRAVLDRHVEGLFARDTWLTLMRAAGFAVEVAVTDEGRDVFVGVRLG